MMAASVVGTEIVVAAPGRTMDARMMGATGMVATTVTARACRRCACIGVYRSHRYTPVATPPQHVPQEAPPNRGGGHHGPDVTGHVSGRRHSTPFLPPAPHPSRPTKGLSGGAAARLRRGRW